MQDQATLNKLLVLMAVTQFFAIVVLFTLFRLRRGAGNRPEQAEQNGQNHLPFPVQVSEQEDGHLQFPVQETQGPASCGFLTESL